jgi:SAM-dependent methyltransferase
VVVNPAHDSPPAPSAPEPAREKVIWHDLECGAYRDDLPLWRELAEACSGPILDIGAGTGRVALDLAAAGHRVTALELDRDLLCALAQRAAGLEVQTVCADARSFELGGQDFGLCVVPMQTIQLFGGSANRIAFLRRARAHLRAGGLLACAIVTAPEPFDCAEGDVGPTPETARIDGFLYVSRPTRVGVLEECVLIERERRIVSAGGGAAAIERPAHRDVIELDRVSAAQLQREAVEAGLRPCPAREVASSEEHVGSEVVVLRA